MRFSRAVLPLAALLVLSGCASVNPAPVGELGYYAFNYPSGPDGALSECSDWTAKVDLGVPDLGLGPVVLDASTSPSGGSRCTLTGKDLVVDIEVARDADLLGDIDTGLLADPDVTASSVFAVGLFVSGPRRDEVLSDEAWVSGAASWAYSLASRVLDDRRDWFASVEELSSDPGVLEGALIPVDAITSSSSDERVIPGSQVALGSYAEAYFAMVDGVPYRPRRGNAFLAAFVNVDNPLQPDARLVITALVPGQDLSSPTSLYDGLSGDLGSFQVVALVPSDAKLILFEVTSARGAVTMYSVNVGPDHDADIPGRYTN